MDLVNTEDRESNLGNFLTDVMVNTFLNMTNMALLQSKLVHFCKISKGEITVKSLESFSGIIFYLVNIRGSQLRSIFEKSVASYDKDGFGDSGDFLQVSGFRLEFDLTEEVGNILTYVEVYTANSEEGIYLDDTATYRVAMAKNIDTNDTNDTNVTSGDAVSAIQDYLQSIPAGSIPGTRYRATECRTWVITKEYRQREYLIYFLVVVMTLSGVLTILSNSAVIYVGFNTRNRVFEKSVLSLAFVDLLTGLVCTPWVSVIYYYSEYIYGYSTAYGKNFFHFQST